MKLKAALILLLALPAHADEISITREGSAEWVCTDNSGLALSNHTRLDKAIESCANRSLSDGLEYRVVPGSEYRVQATIDAIPDPDPDPDPEPDPDPDPPTGWPSEVPAPFAGWDNEPASYRAVSVGSDDQSLSCSNDAIRYSGGGNNGVIAITANDCTIVLDITGSTVRISGSNYVVRDSEIDGAGVTTKNGLSLSGNNAVAYRVKSHHLGGNDRHGFTAGENARNVWIIESEAYYCSGDGFQAGHQLEGTRPDGIYLVRNDFHDCRENGLDYKYLQNVYAVENRIWSHSFAAKNSVWCLPDNPSRCWEQNSGSDGQGIVVGSDGAPINTYFYRNELWDNEGCFRIEDGQGVTVIDGNICRDTDGAEAVGVQLDKRGPDVRILNNTFSNVTRAINQNWRDQFSLTIDGNTFTGVNSPVIVLESGSVVNSSTLTNNVFDAGASIDWNGVSSPESVSSTNTRQ